jgi:hypothetical protein
MIINGGSRKNGGFFAKHLMRADENERVSVVEIRGLASENIRDAFHEMKAIASGTRCTNYFYHANVNTRADEQLTPEQWMHAVDTLERTLGLVDQPRFVVEHAKEGRTHQHIIWSRIDADSMTAISDSLTYRKHETAARELEETFNHEPVASVLVKDRQTQRPERNPADWETFRAAASDIDPRAMTREVTELWFASDSGTAFAAALEDRGYILVRGDRRDFCIIDAAGDEHSLARRITGAKATDVRSRMSDIDREVLPSVSEGREEAFARFAAGQAASDGPAAEPAEDGKQLPPEESLAGDESASAFTLKLHPRTEDPFDDIMQETAREAGPELRPHDPGLSMFLPNASLLPEAAFEAVERETISQAIADQAATDADGAGESGGRLGRLRGWWDNMREYVAGWREQIHERASHLLSRWEKQEMQERSAEYTEPAAPAHHPELDPDQ